MIDGAFWSGSFHGNEILQKLLTITGLPRTFQRRRGKIVLDALGKRPLITCEMCLGEGTGAVAAFPLLDMANAIYSQMSTFSEIEMEEYKHLI